MAVFALDRLFQDGLAISLGRTDPGADCMAVLARYPPETRRQISAAMAEALIAETDPEAIEVEEADGKTAAPHQLESALFSLRNRTGTQKICFLRIQDSLTEATLPLVSLAVAAFSGDAKGLVAGAQALASLWKNLVTLKRDKDSIAIDVYEALAAARAAKQGPPATEAIAARVPALGLPQVASGLKRLADLKLVEVAQWGGEYEDWKHAANTWEVRL